MTKIVEWRETSREPVPSGVWILGAYWDSFPFGTNNEPSPMLRTPEGYWIVTVSHMDGAPTMERRDVPPAIWRFV